MMQNLATLLVFIRSTVTSSFCDFVKFPACAWGHWEESPCWVHSIPANMAFAHVHFPSFPFSPFSLCLTPIANKSFLLSSFLRRLQSTYTLQGSTVSYEYRLPEAVFIRKVSLPQEEPVYTCYIIFFPSHYIVIEVANQQSIIISLQWLYLIIVLQWPKYHQKCVTKDLCLVYYVLFFSKCICTESIILFFFLLEYSCFTMLR